MFVHLHAHSPFSFLNGVSTIGALVQQAANFAMPALAITDHNNLSGAEHLHKACRQAGIKPIIGAEVTLEDRHHLTLLAQNRTGYANLCQLLSEAHLSNERGQPRATEEKLREYAGDIIALSGCWHSKIFSLAYQRRYQKAQRWLNDTVVSLVGITSISSCRRLSIPASMLPTKRRPSWLGSYVSR